MQERQHQAAAEAASSFPCDDLLTKPQAARKAASPPVEATWGMSSSIEATWGAPSGEDVASSAWGAPSGENVVSSAWGTPSAWVHLVLKMWRLLLGLHLCVLECTTQDRRGLEMLKLLVGRSGQTDSLPQI